MDSEQESIAFCTARNQSPCKIINKIVHHTSVPLYNCYAGIGQIFFDILDINPECIGQIDAITDERMTFAQIKERSIRCALWLESNDIQFYDTVAVLICNYLDCMTAALGGLFIGACVSSIPEQMDVYKCRHFLTFIKPRAVFVNVQLAKIMSEAAKMEGVSVVVIIFDPDLNFELRDLEFHCISEIINEQNSDNVARFRCNQIPHMGSYPAVFVLSRSNTWLNAITILSHDALLNNIRNDSSFPKNSREHNIVMWFNAFPQTMDIRMLLQSIYFRKTLIVLRDTCVEKACEMVEKYKVKWLWMRSFNAMRILKKKSFSKYNSLSLKTIVIDDVGMRIPLRQDLKEALPNTEIIFVYSMAELGGVGAIHTDNNKISSTGYGLCCSELKVVDETIVGKLLGPNEVGNLVWRSPYLMNGYVIGHYYDSIAFNEITRKDLDVNGWFHSNDRGYYDEDGEIYILERKNAIRIDGGFVYLSEIESILRSIHSGIREVAVIFENKDSSNILFAFVSKDNCLDITKNQLISTVRQILMEEEHRSSLFIHVVFLKLFPRTKNLDIDKKELRKIIARIVKDTKEGTQGKSFFYFR